jgi:hypothetical protein
MKWFVRITLAVFALGWLAACAPKTTPAPKPTAVPTVAPTAAPAATAVSAATAVATAAATAGATGAGAKVPAACSDIVALVGTYMGGVASTKSLGTPQHLSCEFANSNASTIVIVNIGAGGTPAAFESLRTTSAQGGRTVTAISGLGTEAFSVSKGNVPAGVAVLTAQGLVYDVNSNLPIAKDEALIKDLMKLA